MTNQGKFNFIQTVGVNLNAGRVFSSVDIVKTKSIFSSDFMEYLLLLVMMKHKVGVFVRVNPCAFDPYMLVCDIPSYEL